MEVIPFILSLVLLDARDLEDCPCAPCLRSFASKASLTSFCATAPFCKLCCSVSSHISPTLQQHQFHPVQYGTYRLVPAQGARSVVVASNDCN